MFPFPPLGPAGVDPNAPLTRREVNIRFLVAAGFITLSVVGLVACNGDVSSQEAPGAVAADPQHYSVEFENEQVRVLRVRYGPGEASVMHRHPATCVFYFTDADGQFEMPGGEIVDAGGSAGDVGCGDATVHLPSNIGDEPFEVAVVEFKGRETFTQ